VSEILFPPTSSGVTNIEPLRGSYYLLNVSRVLTTLSSPHVRFLHPDLSGILAGVSCLILNYRKALKLYSTPPESQCRRFSFPRLRRGLLILNPSGVLHHFISLSSVTKYALEHLRPELWNAKGSPNNIVTPACALFASRLVGNIGGGFVIALYYSLLITHCSTSSILP
jgi:hypothetical protein